MVSDRIEGTARERLLKAADELFYREGIHTVGIDRVIERAGVAKASLYSAFGSKEELVLAYLKQRAERRQRRVRERIARYEDPRARILALFEFVCELVVEPGFRGCAFANASAEGPSEESRVNQVCIDSRAWTRMLLVDLARETGAEDPDRLGRQLALLYDGAMVAASADRDPTAAREALAAAELLLDTRLPPSSKKRAGRADARELHGKAT